MAKNKKPENVEEILNDLTEVNTEPQPEPQPEQPEPQPEQPEPQPEQPEPQPEQPEQPEPQPEQPEPQPEQPEPQPEQPEPEPEPIKKKDGRGRPRKSDTESRQRLFKEPVQSQSETKTQAAATEAPKDAAKQLVAISGNMLLQTIDLFGINIVPIAAKLIDKKIDLTPQEMALTPQEKAYMQPLCDGVAPDLKLGVWEMFFLGLATVYGSKIIPKLTN